MSSLLSARRRFTALFVLVVALAGLSAVPAANANIANPKPYYLALGDSLAYGYHAQQFSAQLTAHYPVIFANEFNDGYVDKFSAAINAPNTVNLGCPGETSDSLINGYVYSPTNNAYQNKCAYGNGFLYAWLHQPYSAKSQLDAARNTALLEVREMFLKARAAEKSVTFYTDGLLPQAEHAFGAAVAGYQTGQVNFVTLLEAQRSIRDARLGYYKALVEYEQSVVEIEKTVGVTLARRSNN